MPRKALEPALCAGVFALTGIVVLACRWIPVTLLLRAALVLVALTAIMGFIVLIRVAQPGLERRRVGLMMLLFCGATVFWCAEEQAGVSLTLFAERFTDRHVLARDFPAAWYQSLYPLYVVLFAPFFVWAWQRLAALGREPSNILKFGAGMLIGAIGLGVATLAAIRAESAGAKVGAGMARHNVFVDGARGDSDQSSRSRSRHAAFTGGAPRILDGAVVSVAVAWRLGRRTFWRCVRF